MMAFDNYFASLTPNSLDNWDPHSFELGDLNDILPFDDMESTVSSEASTGYLQDAVAEWNERSKRRRVAAATEEFEDLLHGLWDSNGLEGSLGNLNCLFQDSSTITDDDIIMNLSMPTKETTLAPTSLQENPLSPPSSHDSMPVDNDNSQLASKENKHERQKKKKKKKKKKVVYPFAVVKPGGLEGDVTLADINRRMLMRPTRAIKHPVSEFAFRPCVTADGPGLSGKAVVGLTRIHTQGRGTITIIRTRG